MKASELVSVPVWKGNRIIDSAHVAAIRSTVGSAVQSLDFGYRLVTYNAMDAAGRTILVTELVDGQHRHAVLCEHFKPPYFGTDFDVVVTVKHVDSELEIIEYFNTLNSVKSIIWTDTNLVVNAYIAALERAFNKPKHVFIRKAATHRPYLSAEKIREELKKYSALPGSKSAVEAFVGKVVAWNTERMRTAELEAALSGKSAEALTKAAGIGFMLAIDAKLPWIRACI